MRSIKVRVLMTVIVCTLLTAFICGGVSVFNSSKTVYEDSEKELQYACENQAFQLDRKMVRRFFLRISPSAHPTTRMWAGIMYPYRTGNRHGWIPT